MCNLVCACVLLSAYTKVCSVAGGLTAVLQHVQISIAVLFYAMQPYL